MSGDQARPSAAIPAGAISISGIGMVTSVGYGATPAAAAVRAGIARSRPLRWEEFDDVENEVEPVMGHPLHGISDGYVGVGRYVRLCSQALHDLFADAKIDPADAATWNQARVYIAMSPFRTTGLEDFTDVLANAVGPRTAAILGWQIATTSFSPIVRGHTSCAAACGDARTALADGEIERAVVLCVDSLVDDEELEWLFGLERLKTESRPAGLMPGEAAAALLLETAAVARARGGRVQGVIESVAAVDSPEGEHAETPLGRSDATTSALESAAMACGEPFQAYVDLNGETWRAQIWGTAISRCSAEVDWDRCSTVVPAICLGETGAASGGVAVCLATRSYARNYGASTATPLDPDAVSPTLILSTGESGDAASIVLRAGDTAPAGDQQ